MVLFKMKSCVLTFFSIICILIQRNMNCMKFIQVHWGLFIAYSLPAGGPRATVTPQASSMSPIDRGETSMRDYHSRGEFTMEHSRGEFTMEPSRTSPKLQRQETAGNSQRGKDSKQIYHGSNPFQECSNAKEAKKLKSDRNDSFQHPRPKQRRRVTVKDTNRAVADRAAD